jgi:hypothetical protein
MGVDNVKKKINEIVKSIYKNNYTLNKAGIVKYMHSDPGRAKITQIEKKNKVVVEMKYRDDSDDEARESVHTGTSMLTWTETAVCSTPTGQTITTVVGDITDLSVDVLVNRFDNFIYFFFYIVNSHSISLYKNTNIVYSQFDMFF